MLDVKPWCSVTYTSKHSLLTWTVLTTVFTLMYRGLTINTSHSSIPRCMLPILLILLVPCHLLVSNPSDIWCHVVQVSRIPGDYSGQPDQKILLAHCRSKVKVKFSHTHQMALPVNGSTHLIPAYYSFIDPERMKGWVGLVGWPVADGLPTLLVTHQLQVERRIGKVRQSETDVLPLCHATNCRSGQCICLWCICM